MKANPALKIDLTNEDYQRLYKAIEIIEEYETVFEEHEFETHRNTLKAARLLLSRLSKGEVFYNTDN